MKEVRKKENARGANEVEKDTVTKKEERRAEKTERKESEELMGREKERIALKKGGRGGEKINKQNGIEG